MLCPMFLHTLTEHPHPVLTVGYTGANNIELAVKGHACVCFEVVQEESSGELL